MECYIIKPAQSLSMRHLVIGQRQKAPNFSAFHWSRLSDYHWSAFHNHEGSTFTKNRNKLNYRIGPKQSQSPAIAAMPGPHSLVRFRPGCAGRA